MRHNVVVIYGRAGECPKGHKLVKHQPLEKLRSSDDVVTYQIGGEEAYEEGICGGFSVAE